MHGVGIDPSIVMASLKATLSAVQRVLAEKGEYARTEAACCRDAGETMSVSPVTSDTHGIKVCNRELEPC